MQVGIFAKTFPRPTLGATFDAVAAHGITHVQFNMSCVGLPTLPPVVEPALCDEVARAASERGLTLAAVSGTFNMAHPDPAVREAGLAGLGPLLEFCRVTGVPIVTLCTGTRDPDDMWRRHPENDGELAWRDLRQTVERAVAAAESAGVTLAFEPEVGNVVSDAGRARRLLDEVPSPRLRVVMDPANLFPTEDLSRMREVIARSFDLVGEAVVLAHAKDLARGGEAGHEAAGTGSLDYDLYLEQLRRYGYNGPLILHGLREDQVAGSVAFLRGKLGG